MATNVKSKKPFAHDTFMEQARKEGRVRSETLSMKILKPDLALQARVNHIDKDHVRKLHELLKTARVDGKDGHLNPIVVFEVGVGKFKIADGFHRHEVYKREGLLGIPCIVVKGTLQEAIEYAASCNRILSLPRSREDIKKAAWMLFENGWINKSTPQVVDQVGSTQPTIDKYRAQYCLEKGIDAPTSIIRIDGTVTRKRKTLEEAARLIERDRGNGRKDYRANLGYKTFYLGTNKENAEKRLKEMDEERRGKFGGMVPFTAIIQACASRGLGLLPVATDDDSTLVQVAGYKTKRSAVTTWEDGRADGLLKAIGSSVLIAGHWGLSHRFVVKKTEDHGFHGIIDAAKQVGVDVVTLEQFIEAVKADEVKHASA